MSNYINIRFPFTLKPKTFHEVRGALSSNPPPSPSALKGDKKKKVVFSLLYQNISLETVFILGLTIQKMVLIKKKVEYFFTLCLNFFSQRDGGRGSTPPPDAPKKFLVMVL